MTLAHSVWYMFKHMEMKDWGEGERKIAKWMMPTKVEPKPTHRLDDLIGSLWHGSWYLYRVMAHMRAENAS